MPVAGTVKVAAHVQVAGGRVASIRAAAGTGLDPVSEVLYYHRDMQGSVVATTYRTAGLSGAMGARYRYTPYGQLDQAENVTALSDSELGYTGGLRLGYAAGAAQQGNLVLLGARVYHAELKRWLVPDTVDGRRFTYVGGDPVNFVDPSGRMAISGGGGVGGGGSPGRGVQGGADSTGAPSLSMAVGIPRCEDITSSDPFPQVCRMSNGTVVDPRKTAVCVYANGSSHPCGTVVTVGGNSRPPPPGSTPANTGGSGGGGGRPGTVVIAFWNPVGWGRSSIGHVSASVRGYTYSWGPDGMAAMPDKEYLGIQAEFRSGRGFVIGMTEAQVDGFESALNVISGFSSYDKFSFNCTDPVENALVYVGLRPSEMNSLLPSGLAWSIQSIAIGETYYQGPDRGGIAPPWSTAVGRSLWSIP